jgi:hypothetical protein
MKKNLFFAFFIFIGLSLSAQDNIVAWTFPTGTAADTLANFYSTGNNSRSIRAEDSTGNIRVLTYTNGVSTGDYAATATGWDNGQNLKYWSIKFKTQGFTSLTLSSKQRSGNNPVGPKDFKVQWKMSGGQWTDLTNGTVTLGNDWTTGVLASIALPVQMENSTSSAYIRWTMASNNNLNGTAVDAAAVSKIDDIYIKGIAVSGIEQLLYTNVASVYPNPSNGKLTLSVTEEVKGLHIFNTQGIEVATFENGFLPSSLDMNQYGSGIYFFRFMLEDDSYTQKVIVR